MHHCEKCNQPATVTITEISGKNLHAVHLCDFCAKASAVGWKRAGSSRGVKVHHCSFCTKSSDDVGQMVEGPNKTYICSRCVDLAQTIYQLENA